MTCRIYDFTAYRSAVLSLGAAGPRSSEASAKEERPTLRAGDRVMLRLGLCHWLSGTIRMIHYDAANGWRYDVACSDGIARRAGRADLEAVAGTVSALAPALPAENPDLESPDLEPVA